MKLSLPTVTLVALTLTPESPYREATVAVLLYMRSIVDFGRIIYLTAAPPVRPLPDVEVIHIWPTDMRGLSHYLSYLARLFVRTPFMMHCQDDGFILEPERWEPEFLDYDYIGAPWADGVVGNEGFSIQSQRFLWAKSQFEWDGKDGQDWFYCRTIKKEMEGVGIRFAPTALAARFSSELCDHDKPTFGYHGRGYCPSKHAVGQQKIQPFLR